MKKILVCDDATFMRVVIKNILSSAGYTDVIEAEDGEKAVQMYKDNKPDLVLMDITMPKIDGIEAVKQIKAYDEDAKIIMCSAMGQQALVIESIKAGALEFILKPFKEDNVIDAVKRALES